MYTLNDTAWERDQMLRRNTDRLRALMPAFEKVGFKEGEINVRGNNDVIHFPHGQVAIWIKFNHQQIVTFALLRICRLPATSQGKAELSRLYNERGSIRDRRTEQFILNTVELAAKFNFVEVELQESASSEGWEQRFATRLGEVTDLYVSNLPA